MTKLKNGDNYIEVEDNFPDEKIDTFEKIEDLEQTKELDLKIGEKNGNDR